MASAFDNLEATDADEPWHRDPTDNDLRPEFKRQSAFLAKVRKLCPAVDVVAIPNAGKSTHYERIQRWREGARAGALDLQCTWGPPATIAFLEFKNGKDDPDKNQRERLNRYFRMGHHCGVFRNEHSAIDFLRRCGAPFLDWART